MLVVGVVVVVGGLYWWLVVGGAGDWGAGEVLPPGRLGEGWAERGRIIIYLFFNFLSLVSSF